VEFNLSESGVLPLTVKEILRGTEAEFLSLGLKYPESDGSTELRENIAQWYGATPEQVPGDQRWFRSQLHNSMGACSKKADHAAIMLPNYLQSWGLFSRLLPTRQIAFHLVERPENGKMRWTLDVAGLRRAVSRKTKLIVVTNPNNPTGSVLNQEEMSEIIRVARKGRRLVSGG